MKIREEIPVDKDRIYHIHHEAFGSENEPRLVDAVRLHDGVEISLVAEERGHLIGHILFSAVTVFSDDGPLLRGAGLGPIGVLPEWQNHGAGTRLVKKGLKMLESRGCPLVVVVGHPEYYHRFGFCAASKYGLRCEFTDVPDDVFMAIVFNEERLPSCGALVKYRT